MKLSKTKLILIDSIIENYELNYYDSQDVIFELLRDYLQTMTIARLNDLNGYVEENEIN
jgi:hypothetical protein